MILILLFAFYAAWTAFVVRKTFCALYCIILTCEYGFTGETVRRSLCLDALRLEGGTRLGEVLPVILGLADNTSIQLLDLGSQRLILEDGPTQLVCQSLAKNSSLRLLSLEGWTFRIEVSLIPLYITLQVSSLLC